MRPQPVPSMWRKLAQTWWTIPERDASMFWQALCKSQWSRPRELRQQLALFEMGMNEPLHFIHKVISPHSVIETLEALVQEGLVPRMQGSRIEACLLSHVSAAGVWL